MSNISPELCRDRDAFLARVHEFTDGEQQDSYRKVINELIGWSLTRSDKLYHWPRKGSQDVIRFRIVDQGQVFWVVYPRQQKKDAKLVAIESDVAQNPKALR